MKKIFLVIVGIFTTLLFANAQTAAPVVTELRQLLKNAQNNFANDLGKKIEEDPATKNVFYEPVKPALEADAFILHVDAGQNMYILNYDCTGDKINKMIPIVEQYLDELNKMVKEGDYSGVDYKDKNGKAVTDIRDKAGNLILRYTSVPAAQTIYVYGFINGSK